MQLTEALGLRDNEMTALIGAGGKTTALLRLAKELRGEDKKVLVTTTTKIFKPAKPHVDKLFLVQDVSTLLAESGNLPRPVIICAGYDMEDDKVVGLPARWVDEIAASKHFDAVLVEADGAASRLFKVPSEMEPVVPSACSLTIWLMAIKILGKPLDSAWMHRPERAMALAGAVAGEPITQEMILMLLRHPEGCLKGIPTGSRKVALINQADSAEEIEKAQHLGNALLTLGFERVVVNSFAGSNTSSRIISG